MKITAQTLKENREKLNLTIQEISSATKINTRTLIAIESGNLTELPPTTFLRGFVRTYAKFLKLDVDQIMETFYEEMGEDPVLQNFAANSKESPVDLEAALGTKFINSKSFAAIAIVLLIALIIAVKQVVQKYEKEGQVTAQVDGLVIEEVQDSSDAEASDSIKQELDEANAIESSTPAPHSADTNSVSATKVLEIKPEEIKKPEPVAEVKKPEEIKKPELIKKPEPVAEVKKPEEIKKPELIKKPEPVIAKAPQEIIIEALDNTEITFNIDNSGSKTIKLAAEQVHILKGRMQIKIQLKNSGAVNLIHNGKDLGVPGDLGKTATLSYP